MAPDLNSVSSRQQQLQAQQLPLTSTPSNPPSTASSRRTSQLMGPPPPPHSPLAGSFPTSPLPLTAGSIPTMSGSGYGASAGPGDNSGVGTGPGPMRHPRPLTAADLHLQLEKEQEAVVNRLTRELSILRAQQSASVVSATSSTSAGLPDPVDHSGTNHLLSGPSHPTPSQRRHHRSSSSASARSINTTATTGTGLTGSTAGWTTAGVAGSVASGAPGTPGASYMSAPFFQTSVDRARDGLSRQNSTASSIISPRSGTSSPTPHGPEHHPHYRHPSYPYPAPPSSVPSLHGTDIIISPSISSAAATSRYEETTQHRAELEAVKRENEALRRRIRELERVISARRQSGNGRERSESVSTTASVGGRDAGGERGRGGLKEGDEEVVRVGESAGSVGLGGEA
ncbi:MAG: hypothetical protein M1840_006553 [Geoglossum simile]|nr:MAG: hypothetical protein M1840_006553 [Geoglossum simile]